MTLKHKGQAQPEDRLFCRARILYLDDDSGLGRLLKKRLERIAYLVDTAQNGEEGLKMFETGSYDMVITDYHMPGVNGLEVLKELKDLTPVVILTGQGDEKVAVAAMKLGAADYVPKDTGGEYIELLPSIIDRVIERQQLLRDSKQARAELLESEARYRAIVEDQTELICRFKNDGKLTFANGAFCRYFGIPQADVALQNLVQILPRKAYQNLKETILLLTPQNSATLITQRIKTVGGEVHWLQWTIRAMFDDFQKLKEYLLVGRDITDLKLVEAALRESEEKNSALLNAVPDQILRVDRHGTCLDLRPKKDQGFNLSPDFIGQNLADFLPQDVARLMLDYIEKTFAESAGQVFHITLRGSESVSHQEVRLVLAGRDEVLVITRDVTARAELEQQLQYVSIHDSLTGLYNRMYFAEEMRRLESGRCSSVGIVVCDIDGLKLVNDSLGHVKGDELIIAAANVIQRAFRDCDAVARIGGDEYAILVPDATPAAIEEACGRLRKAVADYNEANPELFLSLSVGAAVSHGANRDLGEVFQQADEAMYNDKMCRRGDAQQNTKQKTDKGNARNCPE